jgi:hypothetical protein
MGNEKVDIQEDEPIDREVWECYFLYMEYLIDFTNRVHLLRF